MEILVLGQSLALAYTITLRPATKRRKSSIRPIPFGKSRTAFLASPLFTVEPDTLFHRHIVTFG